MRLELGFCYFLPSILFLFSPSPILEGSGMEHTAVLTTQFIEPCTKLLQVQQRLAAGSLQAESILPEISTPILSAAQTLLTLMPMKVRHFFSSNDTDEKMIVGGVSQIFVGVSLRTKSEANGKGDLIRQFYL